jgi:hypothetical protein
VIAVATKSELERELERAWVELRSVVEGVPEDELEKPGVVGVWSIKDLLGHIAFWSQHAADSLTAVNTGRLEDIVFGEGETWFDDWNAREYIVRRDRSFPENRIEWLQGHDNARAALIATSEEDLAKTHGRYDPQRSFPADTFLHYREHTEHIRSWMRDLETTEA